MRLNTKTEGNMGNALICLLGDSGALPIVKDTQAH